MSRLPRAKYIALPAAFSKVLALCLSVCLRVEGWKTGVRGGGAIDFAAIFASARLYAFVRDHT